MEKASLAQHITVHLRFYTSAEINRICSFITQEVKRRSSRGVVLGLSGGLDSSTCAYLSARCLKPEQIHLFSLPERDSSAAIHSNALSVASALGLPLEEHDISKYISQLGIYENSPADVVENLPLLQRSIHIMRRALRQPTLFPWAQEYAYGQRRGLGAWIIRRYLWSYAGNTAAFIHGKVRLRMLLLSLQAQFRDCLFICTTDGSEYSIGFYDPHGDGVGDIAPLRHLYKTQIRELARALGVPGEVLQQPSSGDLSAGLPNETVLRVTYAQLDRVLVGISFGGSDANIAAAAGVSPATVKSIRAACDLADQRRKMPLELSPPKKTKINHGTISSTNRSSTAW